MRHTLLMIILLAWSGVAPALASDLVECDSGSRDGWRDAEVLREKLEAWGWKVRRIKVEAGCYEVYALDEHGERVEVFFHPVTLEPVRVSERD